MPEAIQGLLLVVVVVLITVGIAVGFGWAVKFSGKPGNDDRPSKSRR
jgi:hypothetical protein